MRALRHYLLLILCVTAAFFLQSTLLKTIALASVSPNLLVIVTTSFGYVYGSRNGMLAGFLCGFFTDLFFGSYIGIYALILLYIGYLSGYFRDYYFEEGLRTPLIFIGVSDLAFTMTQYVLFFLLRSKFRFAYYLLHVILPELVYTMILAVPFFLILLRYEQRRKRRSVDFFAS